jgi:sulfite reductase (NADPH) flavoprotein alpha-component
MIEGVPLIPETAPFSEAQRSWLNGFFAGLFSNAPVAPAPSDPAPTAPEINVAYASQTGTAENLARRLTKKLKADGFAARAVSIDACSLGKLEGVWIFIASTHGDGDPPDHALGFATELTKLTEPSLSRLTFGVLALGDSNYEKFCGFGKFLDERLAELGGTRLLTLSECDGDPDATFQQWSASIASLVKAGSGSNSSSEDVVASADSSYSRQNLFSASLVDCRLLTGPDSPKEIRHFSISISGSGIEYKSGDALGIIPQNCPSMVDEILHASGFDGEEPVSGLTGAAIPLRLALTMHLEIGRVGRGTWKKFFQRMPVSSQSLDHKSDSFEEIDLIDLLTEYPGVIVTADDFCSMLPKLAPRLYSIASSPIALPDRVDLCVAIVRYEKKSHRRIGICSTYLSDRVGSSPIKVYLQSNPTFKLPVDPAAPIIMVGPGTGVAPFRAFLQERENTNSPAKSWLFFGSPYSKSDFLYADELLNWQKNGLRLDLAFSRDQSEKIYVQHRMWESRDKVWAWLEEGAHFYVCGDAKRMAKDVDSMLVRIVQTCGKKSQEAALAYVDHLRSTKRYVRDVY